MFLLTFSTYSTYPIQYIVTNCAIMAHMAELDADTRYKLLIDASGRPIKVTQNLPVQALMRSAKGLLRVARSYEVNGDEEQAFMLYYRFVLLFMEGILPEYRTRMSEEDKAFIKHSSQDVLPKLEMYKKSLKLRYQREHNDWKERKAREEAQERERAAIAIRKVAEKTALKEQKPPTYDLDHRRFVEAQERIRRQESEKSEKLETSEKPPPPSAPEFHEEPEPSKSPHQFTPIVDRSSKPTPPSTVFGSLHQVVLPGNVVGEFLSIADVNTKRNKETCGLLFGRQMNDQFVITHLVIPKQTGTSDSCEALSDEELIPLTESESLIQFGWIHTHPTQTAFMSSIDLHTHCNSQFIFPEYIGVVCAPAYNSTKVFSLTEKGLSYISQCPTAHGHHLHREEQTLYEESRHVTIDNNRRVKVVDLRPVGQYY